VQRGDLAHASALMDECLAMYQRRSRHRVPPEWLHTAAMIALANDDLQTAEARLREGLTHEPIRAENGAPAVSGLVMIEGLAVVASRRNNPQRALRLGAAAARFRREQRSEPESWLRRQLEEALAAARTSVGAARVRDTERAGERLDPEQTVAYALDDVWPDPDQHGDRKSVLTRRELAVAALVVDGLTNREIAARLRIAERTVEAHLEHIRAKLDLRSRAQIAGWAVEHGVTAPSVRR
jgi:DNA-binding NarL/FixJ family response regulator